MNLFGLIDAMRQRPTEEKRQFVATLVVVIMAVITVVWFVFFFATLPDKLKNTDSADTAQVTASVLGDTGKPVKPFSGQ